MSQFRIADFGLRNKGRNYSQAWKQGQRTRREEVAIRAMYWSLTALIVGSVLVLLAMDAHAGGKDCQGWNQNCGMKFPADLSPLPQKGELLFLAALAAADYRQSVDAFFHKSGHRELNPILGEQPSRRGMALFGIAGVLATALIDRIDHPLARIAVDSIVASEQFNVEENVRVRTVSAGGSAPCRSLLR